MVVLGDQIFCTFFVFAHIFFVGNCHKYFRTTNLGDLDRALPNLRSEIGPIGLSLVHKCNYLVTLEINGTTIGLPGGRYTCWSKLFEQVPQLSNLFY